MSYPLSPAIATFFIKLNDEGGRTNQRRCETNLFALPHANLRGDGSQEEIERNNNNI
jgi:hypothetical protein